MPKVRARQLGVFLHLAQASGRRQRPLMRGRMLVLAGSLAAEMGLPSVAAYCRDHILRQNPRHLVRRWPTLGVALEQGEFQVFRKQVQRRYSAEKAERMLDSLGLLMARERDTYYSDGEYAAAILGTTESELDRLYPAGNSERS